MYVQRNGRRVEHRLRLSTSIAYERAGDRRYRSARSRGVCSVDNQPFDFKRRSAFAAVCALNPHRDEISIARQIRAASPIASPNRLIVSLADKALGRDGRMLRALDEMGPGSMMVEGRPFRIDID